MIPSEKLTVDFRDYVVILFTVLEVGQRGVQTLIIGAVLLSLDIALPRLNVTVRPLHSIRVFLHLVRIWNNAI